MDYEDPI